MQHQRLVQRESVKDEGKLNWELQKGGKEKKKKRSQWESNPRPTRCKRLKYFINCQFILFLKVSFNMDIRRHNQLDHATRQKLVEASCMLLFLLKLAKKVYIYVSIVFSSLKTPYSVLQSCRIGTLQKQTGTQHHAAKK